MFPSAYFPKTYFAGSYFPPPGGSPFGGNIAGRRSGLSAIGSMLVNVVAVQGIQNDVRAIKNVAVSLRIV